MIVETPKEKDRKIERERTVVIKIVVVICSFDLY